MPEIKIKNVVVVCVWAEDVSQTAHFYRDVLDLDMVRDHEHDKHRPHFRVGDGYLTILQGKPQAALDSYPERFPIFAFRVADLDEAVARLDTHNVDMPWGIEGDEESRWVMFHDPAGNLLEIT